VRRALLLAVLLAGCLDFDRALDICRDAGGACVNADSGSANGGGAANGGGISNGGGMNGGGTGGVIARLTLSDGGSLLNLGDIELGVPQPVSLKNNGPAAVTGLSTSIGSGAFDAGTQCTTLDVDASCTVLITATAVGMTDIGVLFATPSGGQSSTIGLQANVFARVDPSSTPDGSGIWQLSDGGDFLDADGGPCLDACQATTFEPSIDLRVVPAPGCYALDGGTGPTPVSVTLTSSPQRPVFQGSCYDLAFFQYNGDEGLMQPTFGACAGWARSAGFPFPDEFEVQLYNRSVSGNGWVRPDGVPYAGPQSFAPLYIDAQGQPGSAQNVWYGAPNDDCVGWGTVPGQYGFTIDPTDELTDAGADSSCGTMRALRCFGSHWKRGAPAPVVPPGARRAFVSSQAFSPVAGGLSAADQLCQSEASDAGLPNSSRYLAFLSISGAAAGTRFDADGGNWYRVDDLPVFFNPADIKASLLTVQFRVALAKTARNSVPSSPGDNAWVGDSSTNNCGDWKAPTATGNSGRFASAGNHAVRTIGTIPPCSQGLPIYCFEN
jgi:hypothetical protein